MTKAPVFLYIIVGNDHDLTSWADIVPKGLNMDDNFLNWLAGFIDGEGHFGIYRNKQQNSIRIEFKIKLRKDDIDILYEIQKQLGFGKIYELSPSPSIGSNPQAMFVINKLVDHMKLINILDFYPLRAKKKRDYLIYKDTVIYCCANGTVGDIQHGRISEISDCRRYVTHD